MAIVGHVTSTDQTICLACAQSPDYDARSEHGTGVVMGSVHDPAPNGIYEPCLNSHLYDRACAVCGWPLRRKR